MSSLNRLLGRKVSRVLPGTVRLLAEQSGAQLAGMGNETPHREGDMHGQG